MKRRSILLLVSLFVFIFAYSLQAQTVTGYVISYTGPDGLSTLHEVDLTSGVSSPIGPIGFERCGGMEIDPATGIAYATCERPGSDVPVLITIDLSSGTGTEVGPTGLSGSIGDISFRADGTLFAYDASNSPTHSLHTLNTATGASTPVGFTGLGFNGGNGITFYNGTLYHLNRDVCHTLDQTNGNATAYGAPVYPSGSPSRMSGMDVNPANNTIYGAVKTTSGGGGSPIQFVTYDPATCVVTAIGSLPNSADAFAIFYQPANPDPIPTLSQWGLFLFGLVFVTLGLVLVYKRQTAVALAGGMQGGMQQSALPFDAGLFKRCMTYAIGIGILGFGIIQVGWGEILPLDIIGVTVSIPIIAYMIHMFRLFGKK